MNIPFINFIRDFYTKYLAKGDSLPLTWAAILLCPILTLAQYWHHVKNGRVWAEAGNTIVRAYSSLWDKPFSELFFAKEFGFLLLADTTASIILRVAVPIDYAPTFIQFYALFYQCLPLLLLFLYRKELGLTHNHFFLIALVITFPIQRFEIIFSTPALHFVMSLACAVVLISPATKDWRQYIGYAVIIWGSLTGLPSLFLAPFFLLSFIKDRNHVRLTQVILIGICGLIQMYYLFNVGSGIHRNPLDTLHIGFLLTALAEKLVVLPFGLTLFFEPAEWFSIISEGGFPWGVLLAGFPLFFIGFFINMFGWKREPTLLFYSAIFMSILSIAGSIEGNPGIILEFAGARYFYVPSIFIMLSLILVFSSHWHKHRIAGLFCLILVQWVLVVGITKRPIAPDFWRPEAPPWRQELANFRAKKTTYMKISPPGWVIGYPQRQSLSIIKNVKYHAPIEINNNSKFQQEFKCDAGSFNKIFLTVVTYGRKVDNYDIDWKLLLRQSDKDIVLDKGKFSSTTGENWGDVQLNLRSAENCENKTYLIEVSAKGSYKNPLGFPTYFTSDPTANNLLEHLQHNGQVLGNKKIFLGLKLPSISNVLTIWPNQH